MIYAATITTPKNTAEADALETVLSVTRGLVWRIEVEFPPGCSGLAHIQIFDGSYQLFPATPGESFHGDGVTIGFDDLYLKDAAPFVFTVKTWNLDETWGHTLTLSLGMASSEAFMSRYLPSMTWEKFRDALAEAAGVQAEIKAAQLEEITKSLEGL